MVCEGFNINASWTFSPFLYQTAWTDSTTEQNYELSSLVLH